MSEDKKDVMQGEDMNSLADTEKKEKKPQLPPHMEYSKRMLEFSSYYTGILCMVAAIVFAAIALAVLYNVLVGVAIALFGVVLYSVMVSDNMSKTVGVRYTSIAGGIRLTLCRARYGDVMWVPSSLIGFDVIAIGDRAFSSPKNAELKRVFLPSTLKEIGVDIFAGCEALEVIYYQGSEEEWKKITTLTDTSAYKLVFDAKYPAPMKKKKVGKPANTK